MSIAFRRSKVGLIGAMLVGAGLWVTLLVVAGKRFTGGAVDPAARARAGAPAAIDRNPRD